jgi:hypothetical protein
MPLLPSIRDLKMTGAVDARAIVPVQDGHGGLTIFFGSRPTHYWLAGEWYRAQPELTGETAVIAPDRADDRAPAVASAGRAA